MTDMAHPDGVDLLSFRLADQEYCLEVTSVREIRGWTRATPLPHAPAHVQGVINLRGTVLPVIDLSLRLGMSPIAQTERSVIIVVQDRGSNLGLLVDAVSDILSIPLAALQPPPAIGSDGTTGFLQALTLVEGELVRILNLSAVAPGASAS